MGKTVYTNYWVNENTGVRKEHGTYVSEEEALEGIRSWWDLHGEFYPNPDIYRTNTGALEIKYDGDWIFYRVESRQTDDPIARTDYKLKANNEIEALRKKHGLDEDEYLFDELAEPYRDRLISAYNDLEKVRSQSYENNGQPIVKLYKVD